MCQKQPGLRCAKHANRRHKAAWKNLKKADKIHDKEQTEASWINAVKARQNRELARTVFFSTNLMVSQLSVTSNNYYSYKFYNETFKLLPKAIIDEDNESPIIIGNRVTIENDKIIKDTNSNSNIISISKKGKILWNASNPNVFNVYNSKNEKIHEINAENIKSYSDKPNLQWAIWLTRQKRFLLEI